MTRSTSTKYPLWRCSLISALLSAACAPTLPTAGADVRGLTRDAMRIVDVQDQLDWKVDKLEIEAAMAHSLSSACRTSPAVRSEATAWLRERRKALGGDPKGAWEANDRKLDGLSDLLIVDRATKLLEVTNRWVDEGHCPFWMEPEEAFRSLQHPSGALILGAETGGRFYTQLEGDALGFGGGGALRLFTGTDIDDNTTAMVALESGGFGRFQDLTWGQNIDMPDVLFVAAITAHLRLHGLSKHVDLEAGPVAYIDQGQDTAQWGARMAVGAGLARLRIRGVIPTISFAVGYDIIPEQAGLPAIHQGNAGFRAGVVWNR